MEQRLIDANRLAHDCDYNNGWGCDNICSCEGCIHKVVTEKSINAADTVLTIPENPTNGDMIKAMFPNAEITKIMGSFDKEKLLGYRTWLGGRSQDYSLDWWNAPYTAESEDENEKINRNN